MSWLFSRALVEEYLAGTCSDGERSAPLSENPIQQAYCAPDKMTGFSRLSQFGMTFAPLTADNGAELLTLFLAAFPARTYPSQEREPELMALVPAYGEKCSASFAKFDRASHSLKTVQLSLLEDFPASSVTLPRWGLMLDGKLFQRQTLALPTSGKESGLWPTPTVCGNYNRKGASKTSGDGLATAVKKAMYTTPTSSENKYRLGGDSQQSKSLGAIARREALASDMPDGQLNPEWVEWLMGWPQGWTDLKPLEMDRFRQWQQQHSACCLDNEEAA